MATKKTVKKEVVKKVLPKKIEVKEVLKTESLMDKLMASGKTFVMPKRGEQLEGIVTYVSKRMVLVDIGAKTEGVVADAEAKEAADLIEEMKVGDKIAVFVKHSENDQGQVMLSLRKAVEDGRWSVYKKW